MSLYRYTAVVLISLCFQVSSLGQSGTFEQLSTAHGLSQSNVTSVVQDQEGYIWIGTDAGLNRYDGYEFKIYSYEPGEVGSLPSSAIKCLFVSRDGVLWVGTFGGGLARYNPDIDKFIRYQHTTGDKSTIGDNEILAISEDQHQNIWIGTEAGGLNRLSFDGGDLTPTVTRFGTGDPSGLSHNYVHTLCPTTNGDLVIGTWAGINILKSADLRRDPKEVSFQQLSTIDGDNMGLSSNAIRSVVKGDDSNQFWIGTWGGGLNMLHYKDGQYEVTRVLPEKLQAVLADYRYIATLHNDVEGKIWIGSFERGLTIYNPHTESTLQYSNDDVQSNYLTSNFVSSIITDQSGIQWVGTYGGGLNKYDEVQQPFELYQQYEEADYQISNNFVFAILEDKEENLWVGTHGGGLNKLEKRDGGGYQNPVVYRKGSIPSDIVLSLEEDAKGNIWIGTREGIVIHDPQEGSFITVKNEPDNSTGLWGRFFWDIHKDRSGHIWLGSRRGLNKWNHSDNTFEHFTHLSDDENSLSHDAVYTIYEDRRGHVWVGTADGLNIILQDGRIARYYSSQEDPSSIAGSTIYSIIEDDAGRIWIGTNNGLSCVTHDVLEADFDHLTFRNYTTSDGLMGNVIYGVVVAQDGDIWLSGNEGLSHFNPDQLIIADDPHLLMNHYDESDGLQSNEFSMGAYYKGRNGKLYFGGNNGMSAFDPDQLTLNDQIPPVVISSIRVKNEAVSVPSDGRLHLSWRDYAITIHYAALNYRQGEKNQYAYQLDGVDPERVYAGTRRYVNYTNLDPGTYEFSAYGSNNDDVWNDAGKQLIIKVSPPPWLTWWAYLIYGGLIVISIIAYGRYRYAQARREAEVAAKIKKAKSDERERVRKKSSEDFHDELGNKLTKVSLLTGLLKSKTTDSATLDIVNKVAENTSMISSGLRDFIWILDSDKETVMDLADRLTQFGNQLFEHSQIDFLTQIDDGSMIQRSLDIDNRRHIVLLFKEAMNNTLKYADASEVSFEIRHQGDDIVFSLTDNGIGFELDRQQDGYGLKNMMSRAQQMKASLQIESSGGKGTYVVLYMPVAHLGS